MELSWKVREWLQSLGIMDHTAVVQDDDEPDDGAVPYEGSVRNRWMLILHCLLWLVFQTNKALSTIVVVPLSLLGPKKGGFCRNVPSIAALPIIRPALGGGQQSISDRAKVAMQGYLNHFLGNMDIVNSREVSI